MEEGGNVPVKIEHERDNPYDSKAIAFKCQLDNKWQRIGYVVRECLDHVHEAIAGNKIVSDIFLGEILGVLVSLWARILFRY